MTVAVAVCPLFFQRHKEQVGRTALSYHKSLGHISFLSAGYMTMAQVLEYRSPATLFITWITSMHNSVKINEEMFEVMVHRK